MQSIQVYETISLDWKLNTLSHRPLTDADFMYWDMYVCGRKILILLLTGK